MGSTPRHRRLQRRTRRRGDRGARRRSVVKIQVQVGGRGKGGGVELCDSPEAAAAAAARMLGSTFKGFAVTRVLVEEQLPIARVLHVAPAGSLPRRLPRDDDRRGRRRHRGARADASRRAPPHPRRSAARPPWLPRPRARRDAPGRGMGGRGDVVRKMYELVVERDATLVEMNPLVLLEDDRVVALDAKVTIDDNACGASRTSRSSRISSRSTRWRRGRRSRASST